MSVALILAAGAGRRLGGVAKATLERSDGRSYLAAIRATCRAVHVMRSVVVVGPPHHRVTREHALELGLDVVHNARPQDGMASSVARGFEYLLHRYPEHELALLWPVDHPGVAPATVADILARGERARVVIPTHRGRGGHPTGFGRAIWPALAACDNAPEGARSVVRTLDESCITRFAVPDAGVVADVDTPADRARIEGLSATDPSHSSSPSEPFRP